MATEMLMGIYDPLHDLLSVTGGQCIGMSFRRIEEILGRKLPASAYRHRPWWANEARGHSHAKAWLSAGFETSEVDMQGQRLVFRRMGRRSQPAGGVSEEAREFQPDQTRARRSSLFGALKGTFSVAQGVDLTKPALGAEEQSEWDTSLDSKALRIEEGRRRKA
jgi:hypothetical protein